MAGGVPAERMRRTSCSAGIATLSPVLIRINAPSVIAAFTDFVETEELMLWRDVRWFSAFRSAPR